MKYDFDEIVPRRSTNSVKWDECDDPQMLPLWVADMDFRAAPCIMQALQRRLDHGIFGYSIVPESYYEAVIRWFNRRHHWAMKREHILYTTGVVPAIAAILRAMTIPSEKVLMLTPVYNCFYSSIRNAGCQLLASPLKYENQTYCIDFDDFERKASEENVRVFLLCNPHNPAGRVWTREELTRLGDICIRHGIFILSDEIHCELVMPGAVYTPFASISPEFSRHSAVCTSPSKSFNIAGLQIANITVEDSIVRSRINRAINLNETCDVNPFGIEALQAAYSEEGEEWLVQLLDYLYANYKYLCEFFAQHLPQFPVTKLEGTYLAWIDFSQTGLTSSVLEEKLCQEAHVWLNSGGMYDVAENAFLRINLACPRGILCESLQRICTFFEKSC